MTVKINGGVKKPAPSAYAGHLAGPSTSAVNLAGTVHITKEVNKEVVHESSTIEPLHKGLTVSKVHSTIGVTGGRTINLGNYEFVKIDVTLEMPTSAEDLESTYDYITTWIGEKLLAAEKSLKGLPDGD